MKAPKSSWEGTGAAQQFPWHQLSGQSSSSLVSYFLGEESLCHVRTICNSKLFYLRRKKCYFVNPSAQSLTSDTSLSIRGSRKEARSGDRLAQEWPDSCGQSDWGHPKGSGPRIRTRWPAELTWDGISATTKWPWPCHSWFVLGYFSYFSSPFTTQHQGRALYTFTVLETFCIHAAYKAGLWKRDVLGKLNQTSGHSRTLYVPQHRIHKRPSSHNTNQRI